MRKGMKFQSYLRKKMADPGFRVAYEEASINLKIARLVEKFRCRASLTQAQLAKKAGVSMTILSRIERGDQDRIPSLATISKVFFALGYEVDLVVKKVA